MERQLWAKRVADKLVVTETKIDEAMRAMMDLVAEVQAAQTDMSVSPTHTDPALAKLMESLATLQSARSSAVSGHRRLARLAADLHMRTTGIGYDIPTTVTPDYEESEEQPQRVAR
jgi:hypothetical protein